jgi:O-antigen/teichoic acid export membrane protein
VSIAGTEPEAPLHPISSGASIARNTGAASLAQVVSLLAGYALLYMAALRLGRVGVGTLGVILTVTLLGQLVAALGLSARLGRVIAQKPSDPAGELGRSLFLSVLSALLVATVVTVGAIAGLLPAMPAIAMGLAVAAIVPGAVATTAEGFMSGRERVGLSALSNSVEAVVRLTIAASLLLAGFGLVAVAVAMVAGRTFGAGLDLYLIRRRLGVWPAFNHPELLGTTFRAALPLYGALLMVAIFVRADILILARVSGTAQAGLYVAGHRPVEAALVIPSSLISGLYPVLSRQAISNPAAMQRSFEKAFLVMAGLMAGVTVFYAIDSHLVIRILFPHGFEGAAAVLAIDAFALVPFTLDSATTSLMLARGKLRLAFIPLIVAVVVIVGLNVVLDPRMGALGAAIARPVAATFLAMINAAFSLRGVGSAWLGKRLLGMGASAGVLAAILWLGRDVPIASVPVAVLVYLACLGNGRVVTVQDIRALRPRPVTA